MHSFHDRVVSELCRSKCIKSHLLTFKHCRQFTPQSRHVVLFLQIVCILFFVLSLGCDIVRLFAGWFSEKIFCSLDLVGKPYFDVESEHIVNFLTLAIVTISRVYGLPSLNSINPLELS